MAKKKGTDEIVPEVEQEEAQTAQTQEPTELEKLSDQLLRTAAEYDNYRKRTARERIELEADITARVTAEFLPVLDNLERALDAGCTDENYKKGIRMIYDGMLGTLEKLGVKLIDTDEFNPNYHQAVQKTNDESFESGEITQAFQKGYKIGERVIRFAMVAVND